MTSASKTWLGLGLQTGKGTLQTTNTNFNYIRFQRGGFSVANQYMSSDTEAGGDALPSDMQKVGVFGQGAFEFIPRAHSVGVLLAGWFGMPVSAVSTDGHLHTFALGADQFDTPYFTVRSAPGRLWGEQFLDGVVNGLSFNWRASDYIRAQASVIAGLPSKTADLSWSASPDASPSFIAPVTTITWPGETPKVLSGSIVLGSQVPLDEQFITGSYAPDDLEITGRQAMFRLAMKVADAALYSKMAYDPAAGSDWAAAILKEAQVEIAFTSVQEYGAAQPYKLVFKANGQTDNPSLAWSVDPINLQAGRNVTMTVTGTILSVGDGEPISAELYNDTASYALP
jgi:hypothetical protein